MLVELIVRLVDTEDRILGWTRIAAAARGTGTLVTEGPADILIERTGMVALAIVHWPDVHAWIRMPYDEPLPVTAGGLFTLAWPWTVFTFPQQGPLPPVTVRQSVAVSPPVAQMTVDSPRSKGVH